MVTLKTSYNQKFFLSGLIINEPDGKKLDLNYNICDNKCNDIVKSYNL